MSISLRTAPGVRLGCETLEDRATPAAAYALSGASLIAFDTTDPATTTATPVTGVGANETLVGADFRATDGLLYGLGVNANANTATLYTIALDTGTATAVGTPGAVAFVDATGNPVDLPAASVGYGVSFDPAADDLRVVAGNGLNFRVDPSSGAPVDGDAGLPGSVTGVNPDGAINGLPAGSTGVTATAYTNSGDEPGGPTTQYTLDAGSNALFIQNANTGTQTAKVPVTLAGAPLDFSAVKGFDISPEVKVTTAGEPATGSGIAALTVAGATHLYEINLTTGEATDLGAAPTGTKSLILNTAPTKTVEFTSATFTATESGTSAEITLTRTGDTSAEATVAVLVTGGTGAVSDEFSGTSHVVTFAAGESTATLTVPVTDDGVAGPDQTITLKLSAPTGAGLGVPATATLTITDAGTPPPPPPVPTGVLVSTAFGGGMVQLLNPNGTVRSSFLPYGVGMTSGVKIARGDVTGDGVKDVITVPVVGAPHVKVFDGTTGAELFSFMAFDPRFLGGLSIAAGDLNDDGQDDIVVGAANGASHVKVFSGADASELASFLTDPGSTSGVTVATGDVTGDGTADLVVGAATGLTQVKVFDGTTFTLVQDFIAYRGSLGGVNVTTGDVDGDGRTDIITGTARGSSHVKAFSGRTGETIRSFLAFPPAFAGGVNVAARDVTGDRIPDVLVSAAEGTDHTKYFDGVTGKQINSFLAFGTTFTGGVFID